MGGTAFILGVGWILGAAYYIADPIVTNLTGKSIGAHVGDATKSGVRSFNNGMSTISSMWNSLTLGLSNLESTLSKGLLSSNYY
jgi:hypothetical protein